MFTRTIASGIIAACLSLPAHAGGRGYTFDDLQRMTQTLHVPAPPGYVAPPPRPAEEGLPLGPPPRIESMPGPPPTLYLPQHWGPNAPQNRFNPYYSDWVNENPQYRRFWNRAILGY